VAARDEHHVSDPGRLGFDAPRLGRIRDWMQRYVDGGRFVGCEALIARRGAVAFHAVAGSRDAEAGTPWTSETLARIYSMTKPVTSLALLQLYEEALVRLDDPIDMFIPELKGLRVLRADARTIEDAEPARTRPTIHHLLTQTAGFTYGFQGGILGEAYAKQKLGTDPCAGGLQRVIAGLARLPLVAEPGSAWHYGVSTDVLGAVVEAVRGKPFDRVIEEHVLAPLGMRDTAFAVPKASIGRFASLYTRAQDGRLKLVEAGGKSVHHEGRVDTPLGGAGLLSTASDFLRFAEMLRRGGSYAGERLIGPRTAALMRTNSLPGDLASFGAPKVWSETSFEGVGFGLGLWVMLDPARARMSGSPGDAGWGGMASTVFWVDPKEELSVVFLTQLVPSDATPNRRELHALVHQAIVD
jgi:CubicO group peptidase (beta-lactamase class C family)